jgi:hypothetical protein
VTAKERAKDARLKREYHITLAEFNKVLAYQNNCCAICKKRFGKKGQKLILSVDHCHTTGLCRGLLCWPCNKAIAIFQDDAKRMAAASQYILNPPFTVVLGAPRVTAPGKVGTKIRAKRLLKMAREKNGA